MNTAESLDQVEREIKTFEDQIAPLWGKLVLLRKERATLRSKLFIEVNKITKADVEMSSGDGKPYFGVVYEFAKWLSANSTKRWAEWNGRIYHVSDLVNGRMPDMDGRVDELT